MISKDLGAVSAYGMALDGGLDPEISKQEYAELLASYGTVAQEAADSASRAAQAANATGQLYGQTATARDAAISAKNDAVSAKDTAAEAANVAGRYEAQAESAKTDAESARDTAVDAVDGFAAGAQQALDSVNEAGANWKSLAEKQAGNSEAWAVGQRGGVDVPTTDPAYHNNAKYYAEQAGSENTAAQTARQGAETAATNASQSAQDAAASASAAAESARTLTIDATLTQSGQAADASETGNKINGLKEDLINQLGPNYMAELVKGASANTSGPLMPFVIHAGDSITVSSKDGSTFGNVQFRYYDADKKYVDYWGLYAAHGNSRTFTVSKEAMYVGITTVTLESPDDYIVVNNSNAYKQNIKAIEDGYRAADVTINNRVDVISEQSIKADIINRFNPATITAGKYISINNGGLATNDSFFASDYIYIGDLDTVTVSYTHLFGWYDVNKNWLGHPDNMDSRLNGDLTFEVPENAVYLRFSTYNNDLNLSQIGEAVSKNNYVKYGVYKLPELRVSASQIEVSDDSRIVVDASGAGDYTSFTQAIYDTVDSGIDVLVKPGTYDIVAEYIALFGQTAVDSMAGSDSAVFNGFQYGVRLRKRKVEFAPGAHLVCDWTGHTVNGTHRFSALGVDYNVEIIGLDLDVTATFYCIHDDYGIATPYTVKYENCRVVGHNLTNANCIGGGCKKYSRHILNNCYFDNNLTGSATVRYHNTNAEGAEPEIYVSNCYFNNWFTPRWYGPQTSKMRVYVNNCHARAIYKMAESASYDVDNVELYKWNNEETDPRT